MPVAVAEAIPPSQKEFVDRRYVFRSVHGVSVNNDTDGEIRCNVMYSLSDSIGSSQGFDSFSVAPQSSFTWGPTYREFDAVNYTPGSQVSFTATTEVSGGSFY